jgi:hypothetical protein
MAITDSQKIDYLWKKVGFAATKTDISSVKDATNEAIPSPLQIRGDKIMLNSASIPGSIPGSNTSVVTVYTTSLPIETTNDATASINRTWITGVTDWISPEFGSTYQAKVYISPSGQAGNVASKGTQVFATGSGNSDEWFFDYQSGVLNFIGNNLPSVSFTGNSVYISGARYVGSFGIPNISLGNITFVGNTISTSETNGNIIINAPGTGTVQFLGTDAIGLPSGTDATRPTNPSIGFTRYNTGRQSIEYWSGTSWLAPGEAVISSQTINPDGVGNIFALSANTSTAGILVSINGTLQQPIYSYNIVNNNQIQFTEVPLTSDVVEVRFISVGAVTVGSLSFGTTTSVQLDSANVNVTGNVLPTANVTYSLGSPTLQWKDLYVSSNTIYMGGTAVTISNGQLAVGGNIVAPPPYGNANVQAYTQTMGYTNYSNVNVKAYTETMTFTNYSNVNVQAYTETMSFKNYSNVNVTAYIGTYSNTITSVGTVVSGKWNAGTIGIPYGGTGATTTSGVGGALYNLVPRGEQTGYVLSTTGAGSYSWVAPTAGGTTIGQSLVTLRQANAIVSNTTVISLTGISYTPGSGQLRVYVNGVRQFPSAYTETSNISYTLSANVSNGDTVFTEIDQFSSFNNYANLTYASNIGNIAAVGLTVQSAINSLETNKAPLTAPVFSGVTTIGGNLVVQGNLFVNGNVTTISANNVTIADSLLYIGLDNPANTLDIGFVSSFTDATRYQHTGLVRQASTNTWRLFANVVTEPTTTVDFTNATYATLAVGNLVSNGNTTVTGNLSATNISGTITTVSQTNITGVGNLTAGTWSANVIASNKGGTGLSNPGSVGNVLVSDGTNWTTKAQATPFTWNVQTVGTTVASGVTGSWTIPANAIMAMGTNYHSMSGNSGNRVSVNIKNAAGTTLFTYDLTGGNENNGGDGGSGMSTRSAWSIAIPAAAIGGTLEFYRSVGSNGSWSVTVNQVVLSA